MCMIPHRLYSPKAEMKTNSDLPLGGIQNTITTLLARRVIVSYVRPCGFNFREGISLGGSIIVVPLSTFKYWQKQECYDVYV